jgi:phage tail-like protein
MPVIGAPRTFHDKFKFLVQVDGFDSAAFNKCSELSVEAAKIEYNEGGTLIPNKSPGRLTFSDVTLERGATQDDDMFAWFEEVADSSIMSSLIAGAGLGAGLLDPLFKRDLDIVQQDRDGATLVRWRVFQAWPVKFVAGEWDNDADEKTIEMVTLTYDFFVRV